MKRRGGKRTAPIPAGGDGMGDCGLYRCARCGGTFAVMPAVLTNGSTRVTAPLGDDGDPVPVRPFALIGGRKWCAECAERRYPRREQTYMDLEEWRRVPRRGAHGKTFRPADAGSEGKGSQLPLDARADRSFLGGCTAGAESAPRESEETGTAERRRGASSRPHAERRAADGPPDRRERNLPAGGGRIPHTPEESPARGHARGLGLVRGEGFRSARAL